MRINRYLSSGTELSRRGADQALRDSRVMVNGAPAEIGQEVGGSDVVTLDGREVKAAPYKTIMFHKPAGAVTSRRGQGSSPTIYDLLPKELNNLNPIGRLDKDTSGLLLLTNDGDLHQKLSHPSEGKRKRYEAVLDRPISAKDLDLLKKGVRLEDGPSRPEVLQANGRALTVELVEGRNRQVRRTFEALGYRVVKLHRSQLAGLPLDLPPGQWREVTPGELPS